MHKCKLLLGFLPMLLVACTPPKAPPISGELEPVNKHRITVVETVPANTEPGKKSAKALKK